MAAEFLYLYIAILSLMVLRLAIDLLVRRYYNDGTADLDGSVPTTTIAAAPFATDDDVAIRQDQLATNDAFAIQNALLKKHVLIFSRVMKECDFLLARRSRTRWMNTDLSSIEAVDDKSISVPSTNNGIVHANNPNSGNDASEQQEEVKKNDLPDVCASATDCDVGVEVKNGTISLEGTSMQSGLTLLTDCERWHPCHCPICLESFEVDEEVTWSSNKECSHIFHKACILEWFKHSGKKNMSRMTRRQRTEFSGGNELISDGTQQISSPWICPMCRQEFIKQPPDATGSSVARRRHSMPASASEVAR